MSRYLRVLLIGAILGVHLVSAQVTTGTISGVVQDSSEGAIPGVAVTVRNVDTGAARTVTADPRGRYTAPDLSLGNYEVQTHQPGFQTEIRSGITLTVGREALVNFALKVGQISERVIVTEEAPLVESTTSSLSSLVDDRTIRDLPLNGRSYDQLALVQPGVVTMGAGTSGPSFDFGAGTRFSVGGSRAYANSFLLDGTDINDHANATPGGAAGNNLGVEGVREFKIVTNLASAEYGRSSGGVISAITRGGTNEVHGSVFEFLRNSVLDAPNFFDPPGGPPPFRRNQFGGALGGPIKKDKTFFFGTYEGLRQGLGTTGTAFVPTPAAKQGNLPTGAVPVNPAVKPFLNLYPDPNGKDFGDGTAEYRSSPTRTTNEDYFMIRVDRQIGDKMSIFGRYSYDSDTNVIPSFGGVPVFSEHDVARRQYSTFQVRNILRPTMLNTFRFAYNRTYQFYDGLPNKPLGPEFSFIPGQFMGSILVSGGVSSTARAISPVGVDNGAPRDYKYNLFQTGDDFTFIKERHSIKTGADIKRIDDNALDPMDPRGVYAFDDFPSLLAGKPATFDGVQVGQNAYRGLRQSLFGFYGQDDFKMSQRLTLNLGLRWEAITDPTEVHGKMSNLLNRLDPAVTVLKNSFFSVGKKGFQPRVGFAWQLNRSGTTVLRAGFGIFHDHVLPYSYLGVSTQPPFYNLLSAVNPRFPNGYLDLTQLAKPRLTTFPPVIKEPVKNSYNLSLQQQLLKDTVIEVAYVGAESHHLEGAAQQNTAVPQLAGGQPFFPPGPLVRANPNFSTIRGFLFNTNANYNALQATLKRKSRSGLQYQAFYTYSKSIDGKSILTTGESSQEPIGVLDPMNPGRDRGLSTFYAKHNFVFTSTYPFPFRFQQKAVGMILGGWTINGSGTFRSGEPFTVRVGFNNSRNGDGLAPDRPNLNAGFSNSPTEGITAGCGPIRAGQQLGTADRFYDPCAFSLPAAGTYGNLGRNTLVGAGLADLDVGLGKNFKPREPVTVQFRAEVFNLLNHTNLGLPASSVFSPASRIASAGRITYTTTESREVQLGMKVIF